MVLNLLKRLIIFPAVATDIFVSTRPVLYSICNGTFSRPCIVFFLVSLLFKIYDGLVIFCWWKRIIVFRYLSPFFSLTKPPFPPPPPQPPPSFTPPPPITPCIKRGHTKPREGLTWLIFFSFWQNSPITLELTIEKCI